MRDLLPDYGRGHRSMDCNLPLFFTGTRVKKINALCGSFFLKKVTEIISAGVQERSRRAG
jgi:hypothetical protein